MLSARIDARLAHIVKSLGEKHGRRADEGTRRVSQFMTRKIFSHDCFDLEVDTGVLKPPRVVAVINERLAAGTGQALSELARNFGL